MRQAYAQGALTVFAALALTAALIPAFAQDHAQHQQPAAAPANGHAHHGQPDKRAAGSVHIKLPDTVLTDQHGKTLRFNTDAVAGRLVLINFIYTTCTTVCPVQSALFADLQQRLGERVGRDVAMLSVTVDPLRDTPLRLKKFSEQYQAGPGWRFLSGSKPAVDEVLKAFDAYTPNFAEHPAVVLVGDPRSDVWTRFMGFPGSEQIMSSLTQLQAARQDISLVQETQKH